MLMWDTIVLTGLLLTAIGAGVAALGVIVSKEMAAKLSVVYLDEPIAVKVALTKQCRTTAAGLGLIMVGTLLQMLPILWGLTRYS